MAPPFSFDTPLYVLAPLAGFTDLPLRAVVKKFKADLTVSEMISSNALVHNSKKTLKMLEKSPLEVPYTVQLAGNDPTIVRQAVEILNDIEGIDGIDLNLGCPAPKVVNHGSGSALLTDLPLMQDILTAITKTSKKSYVSAKMRLGFNEDNAVQIAQRIEDTGVDFLAVHGRTRAGRYKAAVDYDAIARVKQAVSIPVIANGDITDYDKAQYVLNHTQCDGLMIGRAAVGSPWIFYQLKEGIKELGLDIKRQVILEHFDLMVSVYGDHAAVIFRKQLHAYSKGFKEAGNFRDQVNRIKDNITMREYVAHYFSDAYQN